MFEVIVGLACLPVAIWVGCILLGLGIGAIFYLGGWLVALFGMVLLFTGTNESVGMMMILGGGIWGYGSLQVAKS
jgi:hypothetical protein